MREYAALPNSSHDSVVATVSVDGSTLRFVSTFAASNLLPVINPCVAVPIYSSRVKAASSNKSLQRTAPAPCSVMPLASSLESSYTGKEKSVRIFGAGESEASVTPSFGAVRRR